MKQNTTLPGNSEIVITNNQKYLVHKLKKITLIIPIITSPILKKIKAENK